MTTKIKHSEGGYNVPVEVITQHNWNNIGQIAFYGWVSDDEQSAVEYATDITDTSSLVAIFKIKYKS